MKTKPPTVFESMPILVGLRHVQSHTKHQTERKVMNNKFDELAKNLAQSVTRRRALRRFGVGVGAFLLAAVGLKDTANAIGGTKPGKQKHQGCCVADPSTGYLSGLCVNCTSGLANYCADCDTSARATQATTDCRFPISPTSCTFWL